MFEKLKSRIQHRTKVRNAINELKSMTNRDLADIGISRWDIERVVREAHSN